MLTQAEILGFVELKVGSIDLRVPVRQVPQPERDTPLASFLIEGNEFAILVRDKDRSPPMMIAVQEACEDAVKQLSQKLLN